MNAIVAEYTSCLILAALEFNGVFEMMIERPRKRFLGHLLIWLAIGMFSPQSLLIKQASMLHETTASIATMWETKE